MLLGLLIVLGAFLGIPLGLIILVVVAKTPKAPARKDRSAAITEPIAIGCVFLLLAGFVALICLAHWL